VTVSLCAVNRLHCCMLIAYALCTACGLACHKACQGCTGPSADNCVACAEKYYFDTGNNNICKCKCFYSQLILTSNLLDLLLNSYVYY